MYRTILAVVLLALSATPTWARGATGHGHGTMHRLGSNLRHHHTNQSGATSAPPHGSASFAANRPETAHAAISMARNSTIFSA
jgi:hypothetical protein